MHAVVPHHLRPEILHPVESAALLSMGSATPSQLSPTILSYPTHALRHRRGNIGPSSGSRDHPYPPPETSRPEGPRTRDAHLARTIPYHIHLIVEHRYQRIYDAPEESFASA
ncbi:hypothetical protein VTO73DRAFT_15195 [Trametes versicolor]